MLWLNGRTFSTDGIPKDIVERARIWNDAMSSTGAYSDSIGHGFVRNSVSDFISRCDGEGISVSQDDIILTKTVLPLEYRWS